MTTRNTVYSSMIQWTGPILTSLISIGFFQYFNEKFKIEDIFTILNLFDKIESPLKYLPNLLSRFYETVISTERIENFLKQEEFNPNNIIKDDSENKIKIKIEKGNFSWGMPQGNDEEDDKKNSDNKTKKMKNQDKKIPKEIELVEKISIPDDIETDTENSEENVIINVLFILISFN